MALADIAVNCQTRTKAVKQIISVLTVVMATGTVSPVMATGSVSPVMTTGTVSPVLPHSSAVSYF
jgi:hypothetical protein